MKVSYILKWSNWFYKRATEEEDEGPQTMRPHSLREFFDKYHSKGLEIIGVSLDEDKTSWKENIKNENLNWHHIYVGTDKFREPESINVVYGVQAIPAYFLINENGITKNVSV